MLVRGGPFHNEQPCGGLIHCPVYYETGLCISFSPSHWGDLKKILHACLFPCLSDYGVLRYIHTYAELKYTSALNANLAIK